MAKILSAVFFVLILVLTSLSLVVLSINKGDPNTALIDENSSMEVIVPLAQANIPGFQEGSIYTNTTLSSGDSHTCAILDDGSVSCWGYGHHGQLGNGVTSTQNTPKEYTPTPTSSLGIGRTAVAISSGGSHTCAILDDGSVSCWGYGFYGQLGNGGTSNANTPTPTSSLGIGRTAVAISSGIYHTCAILDDGSVSCWGSGSNGQLGNGGTSDETTPTLTSSLGIGRTAVAISSGGATTCVILDNGAVSCWGYNDNGEIGDGTTTERYEPTATSSLGSGRTAVAISAEMNHGCAILDDGSVSCWGDNSNYQLGDGSTTDSNVPTATNSLGINRTAVAISSGKSHTCAILDNGSVSCWGSNLHGEIGNGGTSQQNSPTLTSSLGVGRTVAISERDFDGDGIVNIFDTNPFTSSANSSPVWNIPGFQEGSIYTNTTLSSGGGHTCAVLGNGSVTCWGQNDIGQLGDNSTFNRNTPTQTFELGVGRTAVSVSAGLWHTCAILDDGNLSCWGDNDYGQLGDGTYTDRYVPTQISNLGAGRSAVAISSGRYHTCAILDDGSVSCWGQNDDGQLGDSTTVYRNTPTQTSSLGIGRTAVAITSGYAHTCAILDDGSVSCWGQGNTGQLGRNSSGSNAYTPTQTASLGAGRTAVAITSGYAHTCAILDDGSVACWGSNNLGQLGDGTYNMAWTPTMTSSLGINRTAIALSAGIFHTCAILDNGSVACWGYNDNGQLGDGTMNLKRNVPTQTSSLGIGRTAIAISSGYSHACTILDNYSLSCWGSQSAGQLGNGQQSNNPQRTPILTASTGVGTSIGISERDIDADYIMNIFDSSPYVSSLINIDPSNWTLIPNQGSHAGGTNVTVSGNFSWLYGASIGLTAEFDGHGNVSVTFVNNTSMTLTTPTGPTVGGIVNVTLRTQFGTGYVFTTGFTYLPDSLLDTDGDGIMDNLDDCINTSGNSSIDLVGCPDSDGDGYSDIGDDFPTNPSEWSDADGDGSGDNSDAFPNDANETMDSDGDGVGDNADVFPYDTNESIDSDNDGVGDNADAFPNDVNETMDSDGDGVGNNGDAFPTDYNETQDSDGDGVGDNGDAFPNDANETTDSDGDGVGDNSDAFPNNGGESIDTDKDGVGDNADAFPNDANETMDSDGDGVGDNSDLFPQNSNESMDSDGDGIGDNGDVFPFDFNETQDSDGDGVGDNADAFPQDANETLDSDGDGVGDNSDLFPQNSNESMDSDGDGIGDNEDQYPLQNNFIDTDNDGVFDIEDIFPTDPTQWQDADNDGYGDNLSGLLPDLFPSDETQWADLDGDGYGDNWGNETWNSTRLLIWPGMFIENVSLADHCPDTWGNSSADGYFGCPDLDGDTIADIYDDEIDLGEDNNQTQQINDTDNDGVTNLFDFCPNSLPGEIVDTEGCLVDQDGDGVGDSVDQCPNTQADVEVNVEGCAISNNDETDTIIDELLAGDTDAIVRTVGIGAILIAVIGFMQTNFIAAMLPDAFRWVQVFRKKSKLSAEEEMELGHLQSVVQAYFNDVDELKEELFNLKSDLTARFTNSEIKADTRKLIFTLIGDLLMMGSAELKRIAHDDRFFGLAGTIDTKERLEMLEIEKAMHSFDDDSSDEETDSFGSDFLDKNSPTPEIKGEINEEDGYEYIEHPAKSGRWFIRNTRTNMWDEWKD